MSPDLLEAARASLAGNAKTFRLASRLLPPESRDEVAVLYAFCRDLDDLADRTGDAAELAKVRAELLGSAPARPLVAGWLDIAGRRGIPLSAALDLLDGVESDLGTVRVPDDEALRAYAYRVAGTVGIMLCGVLGVSSDEARPHAVALGVGMQITNIARDVAEDAAMGRVYLPCDRLRERGVDPEDLVRGRASRSGVAAVVRDVLAAAEEEYRLADAGMRYIPRRSRAAILVAARLYRGIGRRLLANGGDALAGRTVLPARHKLFYAMGGVASALRLSRSP